MKLQREQSARNVNGARGIIGNINIDLYVYIFFFFGDRDRFSNSILFEIDGDRDLIGVTRSLRMCPIGCTIGCGGESCLTLSLMVCPPLQARVCSCPAPWMWMAPEFGSPICGTIPSSPTC